MYWELRMPGDGAAAAAAGMMPELGATLTAKLQRFGDKQYSELDKAMLQTGTNNGSEARAALRADAIELGQVQDYLLDVSGYLHFPSVLADPAAAAADAQGLANHPVLGTVLDELMGVGWALDSALAPLVPGESAGAGVRLQGGSPERQRRLRYEVTPKPDSEAGRTRLCHGIRAVWATGHAEVAIIPASHMSLVPPPPDVLSGADPEQSAVRQALAPGDLLLLCSTTLFGAVAADGLLSAEYIDATAAATGLGAFEPTPPPEWVASLSPEQRAVLAPRTTGTRGAVHSDGEQARAVPADEVAMGVPPPPEELPLPPGVSHKVR